MEDFAAIFRKLPHLDLTGQIEDIEPVASGLGPSCEVFKGHWKDGKKTVAVKRLRVFLKKEKRVVKKLAREVYIWSKLKHKNVLPLLGCFLEGDEFPNLVSEWMVKGTLYDYMPNLPRGVWTVEMACGIAEGLAYLHDNCVVHADLKSPNVLLSRTLEPLLADFGVSHILTGSMSQMCGTSMMNLKGTSRWMAVELLATDSETIPDEKSDVWAFGMVIYELLERTLPFNHLKTDQQIILAISKGQVPESPSSKDRKDLSLSERGLWDICGDCWRKKPELRPSMSEILSDIVALGEGRNRRRKRRKLDETRKSVTDTMKPSSERIEDTDAGNVSPAHSRSDGPTDASNEDKFMTEQLRKNEECVWDVVYNSNVNEQVDVHMVYTMNRDNCYMHPKFRNTFIARFSADGKFLASVAGRNGIEIRDGRSGEWLQTIETEILRPNPGKRYCINDVCFSPCAKYLVIAGDADQIQIWDINNDCIYRVIESKQTSTQSLAYSPDGRFIVWGSSASGGKTTHLCDVESDQVKVLESMRRGDVDTGVNSVAISPDSKLVAAGCYDKTLRIWDAATGELLERLLGHADQVLSAVFTSDGKGLVTGGRDRTIKYWTIASLAGKQADRELKQSPSVLNDDSQSASVYNDEHIGMKEGFDSMPRCTRTIEGASPVESIAICEDGRWLISGSTYESNQGPQFLVTFWDYKTAEVHLKMRCYLSYGDSLFERIRFSMGVSPRGDYFAMADKYLTREWRITPL